MNQMIMAQKVNKYSEPEWKLIINFKIYGIKNKIYNN